MKKIIRCPICKEFFRTILGYQIEVIDEKKYFLIKRIIKNKKLVCPKCHKTVGYATSEKKLKKLTNPNLKNIGFIKNGKNGGKNDYGSY